MPFIPRISILESVTNAYANLEMKDYVKYLGLMIDSNLSWKYPMESICQKISKSIGIIAKIRHYVPRLGDHFGVYAIKNRDHFGVGIISGSIWGSFRGLYIYSINLLKQVKFITAEQDLSLATRFMLSSLQPIKCTPFSRRSVPRFGTLFLIRLKYLNVRLFVKR